MRRAAAVLLVAAVVAACTDATPEEAGAPTGGPVEETATVAPDDVAGGDGTAAPSVEPSTAPPDVGFPVSGERASDTPAPGCEQGNLLAIAAEVHPSETILGWFDATIGGEAPAGYLDGVAGAAYWDAAGLAGLIGFYGDQLGLVETPDAAAALQQAVDDGLPALDVQLASPGTPRNGTSEVQDDRVIELVASSDLFREVVLYPCPSGTR